MECKVVCSVHLHKIYMKVIDFALFFHTIGILQKPIIQVVFDDLIWSLADLATCYKILIYRMINLVVCDVFAEVHVHIILVNVSPYPLFTFWWWTIWLMATSNKHNPSLLENMFRTTKNMANIDMAIWYETFCSFDVLHHI